MASNRYRSRRSIGMMVNRVDARLAYLAKRGYVSRLKPYTVLNTALARHAVLNQNIGDGAVGSEEIAPGGVEEGNMADDSISTRTIQADSITANEIAANTITANEIQADTITAAEIAADTITANEIAAGTITATEIAANTITGDEIVANIQLEAPIIYGSGLRAYDIQNPDPTNYEGTPPSGTKYVAMKARAYPTEVVGTTSQITCWADGTISMLAGAGADKLTLNSQIVATRNWVTGLNYQPAGSYASGSHTHSVSGSSTGPPIGSDERIKKDIEPLDSGLDFIEALKPVKYRMIDGSESDLHTSTPIDHDHDHDHDHLHSEVARPGVRIHYGLIAQQVKQAVDEVTNDDFAGWIHTEDDVQMLRYNEFIAPLIKAVQELAEQNRKLQERLDNLESGIS